MISRDSAPLIFSKFSQPETTYSLRDSENKLNFPFLCTNYCKNSFCYIQWRSVMEQSSLQRTTISNTKARHSWKAASYFLYFTLIRNFVSCNFFVILFADEFLPWINEDYLTSPLGVFQSSSMMSTTSQLKIEGFL